MALDGGPDDLRRIERLHGMTVLDLSGPPPAGLVPADGWARAIHRVMEMGRIAVLSAWLSRRCPPTVNDRELALLARQLLDDLEAAAPAGQNPHSPPADADSRPRVEAEPTEREPCSDGSGKLAHPAHRPRQSAEASSPAAGARPPGPSVLFHPEDRAILDKLEHLDDLVYDAIAGREEAMAQLRALWPQLRDELGEPLLAESREQYLRYGLSIWQDYLRPAGLPDPARALHSLDVLCLLFDEA